MTTKILRRKTLPNLGRRPLSILTGRNDDRKNAGKAPDNIPVMQAIPKKYRIIFLLVVLMTGLSITGWSISTHYDHAFINGELQKELKNDSQIGNTISEGFNKNSPILFLISTGLIGLVGVRRQRKKLEDLQSKDKI